MPRRHAKQREWKKLSQIMKSVEADIDKQIICADENLCLSGLYGYRQRDPTARNAIRNVMQEAAK